MLERSFISLLFPLRLRVRALPLVQSLAPSPHCEFPISFPDTNTDRLCLRLPGGHSSTLSLWSTGIRPLSLPGHQVRRVYKHPVMPQLTNILDAFQKIIFAFFGLYIWELFMTSGFEWSLVARRRKFHWPLVCLLVDL